MVDPAAASAMYVQEWPAAGGATRRVMSPGPHTGEND